ncbi:MAG: ATP-binding protein [Myxococcota bacterium]
MTSSPLAEIVLDPKQHPELLLSIVNTLGDGVVACDSSGRFILYTPAAREILGTDPSEGGPSSWPEHFQVFHDDGETLYRPEELPLVRALRGEATDGVELRMRRRDGGDDRWVRVIGRPLVDASGWIWGGVVVCADITASKRLQQETAELNRMLVRRTRDLEAANRVIEAFSHSISHDLRAPLRAIDAFSRALLEDCEKLLDDVGRRHLGRVRAAAQRMAGLIDALLGLSRITRNALDCERVDLSAMASAITSELGQVEPGRNVKIVIGERLEAMGDARVLRAMLENLLGNAWKFTAQRETAQIEFGSLQRDSETIFYVRDDGVGFDMLRATHLFGAFQRMHSESEFPGNGVGLATVHRIVTRHGGRIWAEAEPDRGATFWFTLEAPEEASP